MRQHADKFFHTILHNSILYNCRMTECDRKNKQGKVTMMKAYNIILPFSQFFPHHLWRIKQKQEGCECPRIKGSVWMVSKNFTLPTSWSLTFAAILSPLGSQGSEGMSSPEEQPHKQVYVGASTLFSHLYSLPSIISRIWNGKPYMTWHKML